MFVIELIYKAPLAQIDGQMRAHMKFLTAGIWPTDLLSWMVRDTSILSLEEAHSRLSGMPAWAAGFRNRGLLREGLAADLMIYDLDALATGPVERTWLQREAEPVYAGRAVGTPARRIFFTGSGLLAE